MSTHTPVRTVTLHGGTQDVYEFDNGYGASVVCHSYSYGGTSGLYELAVLHGVDLCYATPLTSDVIGWLTGEEVQQHLDTIAALPARPWCDHKGAEL